MTRQSLIASPVRQTPARYFGGLGLTLAAVEVGGRLIQRRLSR